MCLFQFRVILADLKVWTYERMMKRETFQESFFKLKLQSSSAFTMVHIPIQHKANEHNTIGKLHYWHISRFSVYFHSKKRIITLFMSLQTVLANGRWNYSQAIETKARNPQRSLRWQYRCDVGGLSSSERTRKADKTLEMEKPAGVTIRHNASGLAAFSCTRGIFPVSSGFTRDRLGMAQKRVFSSYFSCFYRAY